MMEKGNTSQRARFGWMALLGVLLLLASSASAADLFGWVLPDAFKGSFWGTGMTAQDFVPADLSWLPVSLAALAIGIVLAVSAQSFSGLLGARVGAWGKNQLKEVGKSALIVIFIFLGFAVTNAPADAFYRVSFLQLNNAVYFVETVRGTLVAEFLTMTTVTAMLSMVGNITPYFRPAGIIGISFSLAPAFRPVFDGLGIILSMMSVSVGEWFVNAWLLAFIKSRMLSLFLPVGLFLRALGLDKTGDLLIAVAIGFFFVYPFMLSASGFAMERYLQSEFGPGSGLVTGTVDGANPTEYASFADCASAHPADLTSGSFSCFWHLQFQAPLEYMEGFMSANAGTSALLLGVVQLLTGSLAGTLLLGFLVFFTGSMLKAASFYVVVVSVLMPLFNLFITLTVIRELAGFMGTTIDLSAFEKLL